MQRRVPQSFVEAWDAWLQDALHASRQQLGSAWLDIYLTSPIWRFVLTEGICGEGAYAGVLLPSVDRVGRHFPLTLVAPLEVGSCILEAACGAGRAWFDAAESLALKALDASELDLDAFDAEVDALAGLASCAELAQSNHLMERIAQADFPGRGSPWHIAMLGESPQRAANAIASLELRRSFRPCALWWTQGSDRVVPGWLVTSGLPPPSSYAAMLAGQWRHAGWSSIEFEAELGGPTPLTADAVLDPPQSAAAPAPRVARIAAAHPPIRRGPDASREPRFITRPEIGLWGLAVAAPGTPASARLDLIADVVHDLAPQATLTTLAELTRRTVQGVLRSAKGAERAADGAIAVAFLLAGEGECAFVWSGAMRAIRIRGGEVTVTLGGEPTTGNPLAADATAAAADANAADLTAADTAAAWGLAPAVGGVGDRDLLALLAAPATSEPTVDVRYEGLAAEDLWVLGTDAVLADRAGQQTGRWPVQACGLEGTLDALLARGVPGLPAGATAPLMLLAARAAEPGSGDRHSPSSASRASDTDGESA